MNPSRKLKKLFFLISILIFGSIFFIFKNFINNHMPDIFYSVKREIISIDSIIPMVKFKIIPDSNSVSASSIKYYNCKLTLFGIPLKSIKLSITDRKTVIPYGIPFGAKIFTEGVMIIKLSSIKTKTGTVSPGELSSLRKGDVITHVNNVQINSNEDLSKMVENSNGESLCLDIVRGNLKFKVNITPVKSENENIFRIGIWCRDGSSGIGTITFCDNEKKSFAGLGHGIRDIDTNELIPLSHGEIMRATIKNILKPSKNNTGELRGCLFGNSSIGTIEINNDSGVYGKLQTNIESEFETIEVAMKQEIKKGPAKIISTVEGTSPKTYEINIDQINFDKKNPNKNISISVCDKELIEKTGGVVQGMSGSPIIQDNRLVGAITHVVADNPLKGYGIFAETMVANI